MAPSKLILAQVLRTKLIPWMQDGLGDKVLVCPRQMPVETTVTGVRLIPTTVTGPRVVGKEGQQYAGKRWIIARWPSDALNEVVQARFVCVLSGRMSYQVNDYLVECNAGHVLIIPSGVPHSNGSRTCAASGSSGCQLLYITPFPNSVQCWLDRFSATSDEIEPIGNFMILGERLSTTYRILLEEIIEQGNATSNIAAGLMDAFLAQLQRHVEANDFLHVNFTDTNFSNHLSTGGTANANSDDFIATLRNYIYAHIHEAIMIDDVAKMMYQSRPLFTRKVRRETGLSFVEFLTKCRVDEAKRLLNETSWGIGIIAQSVGIKPSYFSAVFLQQTGMAPSAFRKQKKLTQI